MLLCYTLQQIEQFRSLGEEFAMQHADTEYMGELEEELQTAVLEAIPVERWGAAQSDCGGCHRKRCFGVSRPGKSFGDSRPRSLRAG